MTLRYRALLIGNSTYPEDPHNLQPLEGPINDVTLLRAALEDGRIGMFAPGDVTVRPERTSHELIRALDDFFTPATRDDVLLLYYSGHGVLDHTATLFLCARDTRVDRLRGTGISSQRLNELIDASAATRIVIILDCCHSGAFKGDADLTGPLTGQGRYVLTSCRGRELANDATVANHASLFTDFIVRGLRGEAPHEQGAEFLTVEELYEYVRDSLLEHGRQRPQQAFRGEGGLPVARLTGEAPPRRHPSRDDPVIPLPPPPVGPAWWRKPLLVAAAAVVLAAAVIGGAIALLNNGPHEPNNTGGQLRISGLSIAPVSPRTGQQVHFGYTLDGTAQTTQWTVTSGSATVTSSTASGFDFTFQQPGTYHVKLVVLNGDARDQMERDVIVAGPAPPNTTCGETITTSRVVNTDLSCRADGLIIGAANITVDLGGYTITGGGGGTGVTLGAAADNVTITNGTVSKFGTGVKLQDANDVRLTKLSVSGETALSVRRSNRMRMETGSLAGTKTTASIGESTGGAFEGVDLTGKFYIVADSNGTVLTRNMIHNATIAITESNGAQITSNTVTNGAIYLGTVATSGLIENNTFSGGKVAIDLEIARNLSILNNTFTGGSIGVRFVFPGGLSAVQGLRITGNKFTDQQVAGVLIQSGGGTASPRVTISDNTFTNAGRNPGGLKDSKGRTVNDGLHIDLPVGSDLVVQGNKGSDNADYAIEAASGSVTDGGSNTAAGDCLGVHCATP